VVDAVSVLFALAFPKTSDSLQSQQKAGKLNDAMQWASSRRWTVMANFISKISKLATTMNIAVLLISQSTTRVRAETGAVLRPTISGTAWESGIRNQVVLFQDWLFNAKHMPQEQSTTRFAGVIKAKGVSYEGVGRLTAFSIATVSVPHLEEASC